jgi:hypothetical protein
MRGDGGAGCWFSCLPSPLAGCLGWLGDAIAGYGIGLLRKAVAEAEAETEMRGS